MSNTAYRIVKTLTIADGATVSDTCSLDDYFLCGLDVPAMTGTALTLEGSVDGVTYRAVKSSDLATNYSSLTVDATGAIIALNPQNWVGIKFFRLTAGTAQGANRLIDLLGYRA